MKIEITGYDEELGEMMNELERVLNKYTKKGNIHVSSVIGVLEVLQQNVINQLYVAHEVEQSRVFRPS